MTDVSSQRAKTAWLQIHNQIVELLNKQLRPPDAPRIQLADVAKSAMTSRGLLERIRIFFTGLRVSRDVTPPCPDFCFRRRCDRDYGLLGGPWDGDIVDYQLPEYIKAVQQSSGVDRKTWDEEFVKDISDLVDEVNTWFGQFIHRGRRSKWDALCDLSEAMKKNGASDKQVVNKYRQKNPTCRSSVDELVKALRSTRNYRRRKQNHSKRPLA